MLRQPDPDPAKALAAKERAIQDVLFQKQATDVGSLRSIAQATLPITVMRELL
jgi:hypothetical protein